jgi:hypothetical protein
VQEPASSERGGLGVSKRDADEPVPSVDDRLRSGLAGYEASLLSSSLKGELAFGSSLPVEVVGDFKCSVVHGSTEVVTKRG